MKINVNTGKRTLKMRILSAFMAFLIFSLTSPELFENLGVGLIVHGAIPNLTAGSGTIDSSTTQISKYMGQSSGTGAVRDSHNADGTTSNGTYTGRIRPVTVSMYDYLTDGEINGTWNVLNDNNYTWYYRYDPYTKFNNAISQTGGTTTIKSAQSYNITIKYYGNNKFSSSDTVYIYLWNANKNSGWTNHKMSFDNVNSCFYFTFSTTNENYIGFTPDRIIFHDNGSKKSPDILQTMTAGNTYTFTENTSDGKVNYRLRLNSSNTDAHIYPYNSDTDKLSAWRGVSMTSDGNDYYSYTQNNNTYKKAIFNGTWGQYPGSGSSGFGTSGGYTYFYNWGNSPAEFIQWPNLDVTTSTGSENITEITGGLSNPLYTGYFITPSSGKPIYNNFYWMPNLAQTSANSANSDAAVQGLVDATLNADGLVQKDGIALPYFDSTWASNHKYNASTQTYSSSGNKDIMKCWESTDSKKISFPFYETLQATTTEGQYAKYYQFNSKDSNLVFHNNYTTPAASYFEETETVIKDVYEGSGFFPYNTTSSIDSSNREKNCKNNNYGFGTKFEMTFKLGENGMAEAVDENGKKITTGIADTVPMKFEFDGDDDLWVFIDGNLVLDIGGAHGASKGEIDFSTAKAKVDKLVQYNDTNKDKLDADVNTSSTTTPNVVSLEDKIIGLTMNGNTPTYDTSVTHKMTIFYMERGMAQSNLYVRYNFIPEDTFTKMKIKEQTDFSGVNKGLKAITQKAADRDVFKYTVSNNGTNADDVYHNTYTNKAFTRTVQGENTQLTTAGTISNKNFNPSSYDTVADVAYNWVDEYASVNGTKMESSEKAAGITGSSGELYLMHGIAADLTTGLEVKSSAEFEGQFKRYSTMTIVQDANLYTPNKNNTPATLSTNPSVARSVSQYYTTTKSISSNTYRTPVVLDDNVNTFKFRNDINPSDIMQGDATNYPDTGVHIDSAAQVTELFVNTVKVGAISVTKSAKATNGTEENGVQDTFTFQLSLTNVFGTDVDVSDYSGIKAKKTGDTTAQSGYIDTSGYFTLTAGQTITIEGIPYGTAYTITETSPGTNYQQSSTTGTLSGTTDTNTKSGTVINIRLTGSLVLNKTVTGNTDATDFPFNVTLTVPTGVILSNYTITNGTTTYNPTSGTAFTVSVPKNGSVTLSGIPYGTAYTVTETRPAEATADPAVSGGDNFDGTGTIDGSGDSVTITNTYPTTTEVDVEKTDGGTNKLANAELELWYKETTTPDTFSSNDPQSIPNQMNGMKVSKSTTDVGVPGLETTTEKTKTYTYSPSSYNNPGVPSSSDKDWILPRNDTDYIYFRDYNTGTPGEHDSQSFGSGDNRTWKQTTFANRKAATSSNPGTHDQDQELGFSDGHTWMAAEFSGSGKKTVRYAVWERFVDDHFADRNTVVWKIQPPDGYTHVRFMMMHDDTCVRKTVAINYKLGRIYHKTNWGGYWTSKDSKNCYYDVPVEYEYSTDTDNYWAPEDIEPYDMRDSGSTMSQAKKYEPTDKKIIFYCNSQQVWHNIHIQFFKSNSENDTVNGQAFPGYMMEPYAYAENNYRLRADNKEQYLTYELTIPKGATHFRINNGVSGGAYSYMTAITEISNDSNTKNGGNYFVLNTTATDRTSCLDSSNAPKQNVELHKSINTITNLSHENTNKTYTTSKVTSDCDYVYFKAPSGWNNVYAYFYGGGNLRDDNWQRACYSSWPGVAPAGTEYDSVHSNTYSIHTTGNEYNGTGASGTLSPESYYTVGSEKIYKFRLPMGDRKNYSKVVFNNGLKSQSGGQETGVIDYEAGYIYSKNGSATKHYEKKPTKTYTGRTNTAYTSDDKTEYIYIKNTAGWQDLHITFYDANDGQILQKGHGYVMDYAGNDGKDYYRIPIPEDTAKFSINNGTGQANKYATDKYSIVRLGSDGKSTATKSASDKFVYELIGTTSATLTRIGLNEGGTPTEVVSETIIAQTEDVSNYNPNTPNNGVRQTVSGTDDTLNIRDSAATKWNLPIGAATVTFYDEDGAVVGSGVMMKTNTDSDGYVWYTKKIPINAASFSVSYVNSSTVTNTPTYPLYSKTADSDGNKTTKGDMFYETAGTNKLSMIYAKPALDEIDDETYQKRGDDLYLVCDSKFDRNPTVTFYANGDNVLRSGVTGKYINVDENGKHWYRVSIPKGAESFKINDTGDKYPIYELKSKFSRYQKDYTLGDMQYSYNGSTATLLYPIFTLDDEYTLSVSDDKTISSKSGLLTVDTSVTEPYADADSGITPATDVNIGSTLPVLYDTASNDITYTWTNPDYFYVRFKNTGNWSGTIKAYYYDGSNYVATSAVASEGTGTNEVYKFTNDNNYTKVYFSNGTRRTVEITLAPPAVGVTGAKYGYGYMFQTSSFNDTGGTSHSKDSNDYYLVNVVEPINQANSVNVTWSSHTTSDLNNYIWVYYGTNNTGMNIRAYYFNTSSGVKKDVGGNPYSKNVSGTTYYFGKIEYNSGYDKVMFFNESSNGQGYYMLTRLDVSTALKGKVYTKGNYSYKIEGNNNVWNGPPEDIPKPNGLQNMDINVYDCDDVTSTYGNATYFGSGTTTYTVNTITFPNTPASPTTYTVTYQPEDRYGMISDENTNGVLGFNDEDNFITLVIPATVTPYIKFYESTDGSGDAINNATSNASSKGLLLKPVAANDMKLNGTTYTCESTTTEGNTTYKVRLPKNAKSFTISNGTTTGTAQALYENLNVKVSDGSLYTSGEVDYVPITNFHHAGSKFNVDGTTLAVTRDSVRDDYTVTKQADITDPLIPKTDNDYVFFTDTGNTIGGNGSTKTVYAYFYGGADGEYNTYPGIKATTDNDGVANTTYTDNDGNTVYMFRVPQGVNGTYPYVIFNNGVSNIAITQAAQVEAGKNYKLTPTSNGQYGTFASSGNVYPVTEQSKAESNPTIDYGSSSSKYIYIVNNGPYDLNGSSRTPLDDMHVIFYDSGKNVIGTGSPGYKPDKVVGNNKQYNGSDVYRIAAPSNAKYFQITNGTKAGTTYDRERMSEIKEINADGLYQFVPSAANAVDYIEETSYNSSTQKQSQMHFLLDLINVVTESDEEISVDGTIPVHVATVVTGDDGKTAYIKWVKDYDPTRSPAGSIDTAYIANVEADIGKNATGTKKVKVVKNGEYYWVESVAPSGYQVNPNSFGFTVPTTTSVTIPDPPNPTGQLTLNKKLKKFSDDNNASITSDEKNTQFTFTITLTAPVGTDWSKYTLQKDGTDITTGVTTEGLTRTVVVTVPATGTDVVISNIPSGTYYTVTETSPTNYSDEPVTIYKDGVISTNLDEISGNIPSDALPKNNVSYAVTNKREIGGLTLEKVADGEYAAAGVNVTNNTTHEINYTEFTYTVTLTAPENVDFRDYITWADFTALGATVTKINGTAVSGTPETDFNNAAPLRTIEFTVKVKANNGSKLVKNLPIGTKYTVTEVDPTSPIDTSNWSKSGEVTTATEMTITDLNPTVTITNTFGSCEIVLTKTAKEKVGTTDIGNVLAGAKFKLVDANDDSKVIKFSLTTKASDDVTGKQTNVYSANTSGTHNVTNTWLKTGEDGRLHIKGLSPGDYYLEEQEAPNGYSNLDSNRLDNSGNAQPKRVYFSVGENTKTKEITCSDEMAPAYIKLYEHINEYRPTEWGNPTFIFKIKQTGYYAWSTPANEGDEPEWQLTATNSGRETLVALTVNDNGTLDANILSNSVTRETFTDWFVESTDEMKDGNREYQGMFDIDSQGRIRVEPGSYEITRMPVSRYEFVTSATTAPYDNGGTAGTQTENLKNNIPQEKVTISPLAAGKTVDVHYYDKVAYYDKFSQVDEEINKFYTLDINKKNTTVKGIRIADYHQVGTTPIGSTAADTVEVTDDTTNPATTTQTMTVPVGNLKIFKIMSDGSEVAMTSAEKAALTNFNITYTYDSNSGDKREFGGKAAEGADPAVPAQFSYNTSDKQIVVTDAADFQNGVYTLKAKYKTDANTEFTTTFDLVFLRSST